MRVFPGQFGAFRQSGAKPLGRLRRLQRKLPLQDHFDPIKARHGSAAPKVGPGLLGQVDRRAFLERKDVELKGLLEHLRGETLEPHFPGVADVKLVRNEAAA